MDGETFENLPEGKKQAILNAGILCFGHSGYEKNSIAEIAKATCSRVAKKENVK
jgi:AcrR family transcriptional regulator